MKHFDLGVRDGIARSFHIDEVDNKVHTVDETTPSMLRQILDRNHEKRRDGQNRASNTLVIANLPLTVLMKWDKEWRETRQHSEDWDTFLDAQLRDYNHAYFLTTKRCNV